MNKIKLYEENIMEHYRNPKNFGVLDKYDCTFHDSNPLCGDEIDIYFNIESSQNLENKDLKINELKFKGTGCVISIASSSMLFENIKGKTISEIASIKNEEVLKSIGTEVSVSRVKCALLGLFTLKKAIAHYAAANKINIQSNEVKKEIK